MPQVDFSDISRLFQEKGSDRVSPGDPGIAANHLAETAANTPPQPSSLDRVVSSTKKRVNSIATEEAFRIQQNIPYLGQNIVGERMRKPYAGGLQQERVGFVLTSDLWRENNKALALHAGPSSVEWSLALRAQDEEIKGGHARYAQARNAHAHGAHGGEDLTWFDLPRVSFQFQAGNLMPIPGIQNEVGIPYGLQDFYLFLELLNQPPLLPSGQNEGKHNYVWVFYTSLQFPQVVLRGYFEPEGVSWSDNADEPTDLKWSASFVVHQMSPNIWDSGEVFNAYKEFMRDAVTFF